MSCTIVSNRQRGGTTPDFPDDPVYAALHGPHSRFAVSGGDADRACRYHPSIGPFAAVRDVADPRAWADLGTLVPGGERIALVGPPGERPVPLPDGWTTLLEFRGIRMSAPADVTAAADDEIVALTRADAAEMLALATLTEPGPFGPDTVDLGGYLGVRHEGRLIAMAGRRMRPAGWCEVSAVCTHPDFRGRGLSRRLVAAVTAGIHADGDRAFLHVTDTNVAARALYRSMGFGEDAQVIISVVAPRG